MEPVDRVGVEAGPVELGRRDGPRELGGRDRPVLERGGADRGGASFPAVTLPSARAAVPTAAGASFGAVTAPFWRCGVFTPAPRVLS